MQHGIGSSRCGSNVDMNNVDLHQVQLRRSIFEQASDPKLEASTDMSHLVIALTEDEKVKIIQKRNADLFQLELAQGNRRFATLAKQESIPISINSPTALVLKPAKGKVKNPLHEYQPIIKNLQTVALRNRNFLKSSKMIMPNLRSDSLSQRKPGSTREPNSPQSPSSPLRKQFYHKYLVDTDVRKPQSIGDTKKVRNMVYANK